MSIIDIAVIRKSKVISSELIKQPFILLRQHKYFENFKFLWFVGISIVPSDQLGVWYHLWKSSGLLWLVFLIHIWYLKKKKWFPVYLAVLGGEFWKSDSLTVN